jgi:LacI family transcriptional regulator
VVNDLVAIGFAKTMIERGLRIPEDISIAGFGDVPDRQSTFGVPLTTANQPK